MSTKEFYKKQGILEILENADCAMAEEDFCHECNTHKFMCGHQEARLIFIYMDQGRVHE